MTNEFGTPVKLDMAHPLCKTLNILLESKKNYRYRDAEAKAKYQSQFVLVISKKMRKEVGAHLSPTRIQQINTIAKKYFYDRMFDHLDVLLFQDPNFVIKQGALNYLLHKQIPLDIVPLETVLKAYRRYRRASPTSFIKTDWNRKNPNNYHDTSYIKTA